MGSEKSLNETEKWILRLLFAPEQTDPAVPIDGRTRLVKGLFLIDRMFAKKFPDFEGTGYEYDAYKYGPFDQDIYDELERLEELGLVTEEERPGFEGDRIELTTEGKELAADEYYAMQPEQQSHLSWIKRKHVQQPVAQLLSFVYDQYPEMAEESEYRDR